MTALDLGRYVAYVNPPPRWNGGWQVVFKFPNGRGASVACTPSTHGVELAEVELRGGRWRLACEMPLTDLDFDGASAALTRILKGGNDEQGDQ